jgi:hypothetical protein
MNCFTTDFVVLYKCLDREKIDLESLVVKYNILDTKFQVEKSDSSICSVCVLCHLVFWAFSVLHSYSVDQVS